MLTSQRPIDRQDHLRKDDAAMDRLWEDPEARVLLVCQGKCLVNNNDPVNLVWLPVRPNWQRSDAIFLGTTDETPWFALNLDENAGAALERPQNSDFMDLRTVGMRMNADDGALLIYAKGLCFWHRQTQHCELCGSGLQNVQGGHAKQCSNPECSHMVFPRTDPAVIMLVTRVDSDGVEQCLLGRSPAWPAGMYSTLAGFVESGESLEQAVAREVFEEAGVRVEDVQYMASQPWPFPRSIMLGFKATATTEEIKLDENELEDAQWFSRDALNGFGTWGDHNFEYQLPRSDSIASFLISHWRQNQD